MKVFIVVAALVAASSAQIIYNNGFGLNQIGGLGYAHHGLAYSAAPVAYSAGVAPAVVSRPAVVAAAVPVATKTQYHAQDELGQASFGHSEPTQSHAAVRDAAGGVRGTFSYISPEGIPFTTHYVADHNGYRVASNALPVGPVPDTIEVAAAKAQHYAAHADAVARAGRKKRGLLYSYSAPAISHSVVAAPAVTYAAAPAVTYAAAPAVTYAAAPVRHAVAYNSAIAPVHTAVAYNAVAPAHTAVIAPAAHHAVAYNSAIVAPQAVRGAVLTKIHNNPGHAVSYRVD